VLEEDDTLATETTSEENENSTRLKGSSGLSGVKSLAVLYILMLALLFVCGDVY
jgi:hypothetical protein